MKNIILAGYYGFGNLGDEAILEMFLKYFKNSPNINNITVLSGNYIETREKFGVDTINRFNVFSIMKKLIKADALVFGGGSLLQDVTSHKSINYYLFLIKLAKFFGKKVFMLSQGLGPINYPDNVKRTRKTLKKVDYITVRDEMSLDFLKEMGIDPKKYAFSADPVIGLEIEKERIISKERKVCFSLRNWKDANIIDEICKVIDILCDRGIKSYFICFDYQQDLELVEEIEKKIGDKAVYIKKRLTTNETVEIIKDMDLLVGIRLHALILAATSYVPFIALSYDPKIDQFLSYFNMHPLTNINENEIDVVKLIDAIDYSLNNNEQLVNNIKETVVKLRETINVNMNVINNI